ncbi:MAG: GC-type dockerin domain-anchored protein [Phycisphaerales bacterium JB060]
MLENGFARMAGSALLVSFLTARAGLAGPGVAEHALLVVDPSSPDAMRAANEYIAARNLPETAVLYMTPDAADFMAFRGDNLAALFGEVAARGVEDRADYVIIAPPSRYRMGASTTISDACSPVNNFGISSAYTMAFYADEVLAGGLSVTRSQPFFRPIGEPLGFDSEVAYAAGNPSTSSLARRSYIGAVLGWTGERGNTIEEIVDMIGRSVASDGVSPGGSTDTYYFMNTGDVARNVRQPQYARVITDLTSKGASAVQQDGQVPGGGVTAAGIMTGVANPPIDTGDFVFGPAAFADHLTSFAGHFGTDSQTKMSRWIAKGAVGSSGTVEEPCNYTGKFPHPRLHYFYDQGATLGEAYLRSIGFMPFQVQFIGDPLARPFTHIPDVTIIGLGTSATGIEAFSASATTTKPGASIGRFVLLANGVTVAETGSAGQFQLDTMDLPDGANEIRVIAYDDTGLESRGSETMMVTVNNRGRLPGITPSSFAGDLSTRFDFELDAPGAEEVRLVRAGAVLGAVDGGSGSVALYGINLGEGPTTVWAEASYTDGSVARSPRQTITVDGGAFGPSTTPVAYDYTRTIEPGQSVLVSLPAQVGGDPADVGYEITGGFAGDAELLWNDGKAFALVRLSVDAAVGDSFTYRVSSATGSDVGEVTIALPDASGCRADLDGDGSLTIFDFLAFQNLFDAGDPAADFDGDGSLTIFDFLAFQNEFDAGC